MKICREDRCQKKLRSDNASGLCTQHYRQSWARINYQPSLRVPVTEEAKRLASNKRVREFNKRNPDKKNSDRENRRAKQLEVFVEPVNRSIVFERDEGVCYICLLSVDPLRWHLDHIIPLAKGGEHSYANTAVSHPICNMKKGAKLIEEVRWLQQAESR